MVITGAVIVDQNGNQIDTGTIVNIDCNGCNVYISYVDASDNLKVVRSFISSANSILATNCTPVS